MIEGRRGERIAEEYMDRGQWKWRDSVEVEGGRGGMEMRREERDWAERKGLVSSKMMGWIRLWNRSS